MSVLVSAPPAVGDYAAVGDGRSVALVSLEGSVDWLCWPRFDSPSLFGRLLGARAGHWSLRPAGPCRVRRAYLPGTNVLVTRFEDDGGAVKLIDFMPAASEDEKRRLLSPEHEFCRLLECERGELELEHRFDPYPGYGRERGRPVERNWGLELAFGGGSLGLRAEIPLAWNGAISRGRLRLHAGQSVAFSLTYAAGWPGVRPPPRPWVRDSLARTVSWWRRWSGRLRYDGADREAVERSALALRLLLYAPSGAIVAAPTTSLPERPGGAFNWDYRYCWLRDASMTVGALLGLGCEDEAAAFAGWLLHSTRLSRPLLRPLYDVFGRAPQAERELAHLEGHRGSRPVRVGNAAVEQLQLDVYGEVVGAAADVVRRLGGPDRDTRHLLLELGEFVGRHWRHPDAGIWEPRVAPRPHTHSWASCWRALDALLGLHEAGLLRGADAPRLAQRRDDIRRAVRAECWDGARGAYVSGPQDRELDAAVLLLAWHGLEPPRSPRMRSTYERLMETLGAGGGLLYRDERSAARREGAFGICGFWAAEYLARGGGTLAEARRALSSLQACANDVGLHAEEVDPEGRAPQGNFPQGFTHVGHINAALALRRRARGARA